MLAVLFFAAAASEPATLPDLDALPTLTETQPAFSLHDWLSGNLRITGAFLRDGDRAIAPSDNALLLVSARALVDHDIGDHFGVEANYFADFFSGPSGASASAFTTAGTSDSPYRTRYLTWKYWQNGTVQASTGLDRLALRFREGSFSLSIGRFPITYSVTGFLTPNDFFAPFSATAVNKVYKPGVDALRLGWTLGTQSSIEVVGVLGSDANGKPAWSESAVLANVRTTVKGFELSALGGKVAERWVAGGAVQGDLGPIGLRGEGHVGVADPQGLGHAGAVYGRFAVGPNVNFTWHALNLSVQYAYFSDGTLTPADYLARATRLFPDDLPYLGKHYAGGFAGLDVIPILHLTTLMLVNAGDASGIAGANLLLNAANEVDVIAGCYIPWGRHVQGAALGSELGSSPVVAYFEARVSF